jgi:hypothetical protein
MRHTKLASALVLGTALLAACSESPVNVDQSALTSTDPNLAVVTGETFSYLKITSPTAPTFGMLIGGTKQMKATLFYSLGGTLPAVPYAQWRSTDTCIASVTSVYPSWGKVTARKSGTALIISEAFGKADTVAVTVAGTEYPDPACYDADWVWDYNDVSFTGSPATSYSTQVGETLTQVVLFAAPKPTYTILVGGQTTLRSELWYSLGGKMNGKGYVAFAVTNDSVASVSSTGVVKGLRVGRTKVIARLGSNFADTVPLYVK